MWRSRTPLALALAAVLLAPAGAAAGPSDDFQAVSGAFERTRTVDGCRFSARQLASAQKGVPPDVGTYAPELPAALDAALRRRASGDCDQPAAAGDADAAAAGANAPAAQDPATTPAPPPEPSASSAAADGSVVAAADRSSAGTDDLPLPLVVLAALLVLALLAALAWALVRFLALDPPWVARTRHATAEAGWRASASWAEFTDWLRLGR